MKKTCNYCCKEKDETEFLEYRNKNIHGICNDCIKDYCLQNNIKKLLTIFPQPRNSYRYCVECKKEKPISDFWKHVGDRNGLHSACVQCC